MVIIGSLIYFLCRKDYIYDSTIKLPGISMDQFHIFTLVQDNDLYFSLWPKGNNVNNCKQVAGRIFKYDKNNKLSCVYKPTDSNLEEAAFPFHILKNKDILVFKNFTKRELIKVNSEGQTYKKFKFKDTNLKIIQIEEINPNKILILGESNKYCNLFAIDSMGNLNNTFKSIKCKISSDTGFIAPKMFIKNNVISLVVIFRPKFDTIPNPFYYFKYDLNGNLIKTFRTSDISILGHVWMDDFENLYLSNVKYKNIEYNMLKIHKDETIDEVFSRNISKFSSDLGISWINSLVFLDNEQFMIGGDFNLYDRKTIAKNIAVINKNGELCNDYFSWNSGVSGFLNDIELLNNQKILIKSTFCDYNNAVYKEPLIILKLGHSYPNLKYYFKNYNESDNIYFPFINH